MGINNKTITCEIIEDFAMAATITMLYDLNFEAFIKSKK